MDLSIVFPMFWGREKKELVKEGDYFYEGPGGQVTTHAVPPGVVGVCLRWWPAENEGIGQTQVGAMANLVAPHFFPEGAEDTVNVSAPALLR